MIKKTFELSKSHHGYWTYRDESIPGNIFNRPVVCTEVMNDYWEVSRRKKLKVVISDKPLPNSYRAVKRGMRGDIKLECEGPYGKEWHTTMSYLDVLLYDTFQKAYKLKIRTPYKFYVQVI